LDERRAFEPETRAIRDHRGRVMMPDDLNATSRVDRAMPVMKMVPIGLERFAHFDVAAQLPIVISSDHDHFATLTKFAQKLSGFACRGLVVNEVAENDELLRFVSVNQFG
jgi:hypothetical protein